MKLGMEVGHTVPDGNPAPPPPKGHSPPQFSCRLWPNGWMNQDAIWYAGSPRSKPHCVRWEDSSPQKSEHIPQFSADICCDQKAGDIVLDGDSALPSKMGHSPQF